MEKISSPFEIRNPYHSQGLAAGGSALLDAINRGKVHLAKFILDAGECDVVNTRDFKGKTPLIRACYIKEEKTRGRSVELLVARGANVNMVDDHGRTALSYACELRCNDIVRYLVQNNIDPDISDAKGNTALIYSAMVGNDTAIEILIKSFRRLGLNVDHINNDGWSALLIAAKSGFIECASILALDGRACVSFRDREQGFNAEEWARVHGCSTQEVLPFSTTLAMWQYKANRRAMDESENLSLEGEVCYTKSGRYFAIEERSGKETKLIDIEELSSRLSESGDMSKFTKLSSVPTKLYKKRGSLPSMKFSPNLSWSSRNSSRSSTPSGSSSKLDNFKSEDEDSESLSRFPVLCHKSKVPPPNVQTTTGTQTDIIQNITTCSDPSRPKTADVAQLSRQLNRIEINTGPSSSSTKLTTTSSTQVLVCPPGNVPKARRSSGHSEVSACSSTGMSKIMMDFQTEEEISEADEH